MNAEQARSWLMVIADDAMGMEYDDRQAKEIAGLIERMDAALTELIRLKDLKDAHGKTEEYLRDQPLAWEQARNVTEAEAWKNAAEGLDND